MIMQTIKPVLVIAISAGLTLGASAQPGKHPEEKVDLNSLPASVQQTIKSKASGGNIVKVFREDDPDGKWNYEVLIQTNGKDSGFEVDPNGKFVKQRSEIAK
jgi:uncharacterized membrane protein YkoI